MQDDYRQVLTDRFVETVEYLNRQMHLSRLEECEALEMTIPQIKTLALLERTGPLRMGSIAGFLHRALSATTIVVDRLVEKDLVHRIFDPNDRRVVLCDLTDLGRQSAAQFWSIGSERLQKVVDLLEVEDLETVVKGVELIRKAETETRHAIEST